MAGTGIAGTKKPRPRDISAAVARNLRNARQELDPNRTRFASEFGVHHALWAKWEKGKATEDDVGKGNYPDPAVMVALCDRYGLTMDFLYRGVLAHMPNEELKLILAAKPEYQRRILETEPPAGNEGQVAGRPTVERTTPAWGRSGKAKASVP